MSILDQNLALPKTLVDFVEARDRAIADYRMHYEGIRRIQRQLEEFSEYLMPYNAVPSLNPGDFIIDLDKRMWLRAFDKTNFMQIMDRKAKKEFHEQVDKKPPEFTLANVQTTFLSLMQDADVMFARGIVNVFRHLSSTHKTNTNEPFKINRRAVMTCMTSPAFRGGIEIRTYYGRGEELNDIDRVFKLLDGKKLTQRELEFAINEKFSKMELYEDDYYRIRGFKNGNIHIEFKRQDLLDKANRIIHDYYAGNILCARGKYHKGETA
jgi:hypothetical protein